jgi:polyisoprenoid-binding protein YceI
MSENLSCLPREVHSRSSAGIQASPDPFGGRRAGFSATAQINRRDFGIDNIIPMDGGGVVVGDKVSISLEIQAVLQE